MNTFKKLGEYMGRRKLLLPLSIVLSALNGLLSLVPFVLVWLVVRTLLTAGGDIAETPIRSYALWAFVVSVATVLLYFGALMLSHLAAFRVETNMRRFAMDRLLRTPLGFFDRQDTGRMRKIIDEDSSMTHTLVAHLLPDVASSVVAPLGILVLLFVVDWQLGLAALVPILLSYGLMGYMMSAESGKFQRQYLDAQERMSAEAVEYVRGIPVVKVFQQTVYSFKRFYASIIDYRDLVTKYSRICRRPMSLYTVLTSAFAFVLVPVSIILIGHGGDPVVVISDMFLYVLITPVIALSIMRCAYLSQDFFLCGEAIRRLEGLTETAPLPTVETTLEPKGYSVSLEDVSFRYEGAKEDAVSHVTLNVPEGKTIALVGPSGSGKTTLARLIPRFWDTTGGRVLVGGVDVRKMSPEKLMKSVSFVFQNTRLFKTTILENVRYGSPDATLEEVNRAIDLSQSREILDRLPEGLNTLIGAEGTYLSGGEMQRIVLARAILKDAPIVVLDEATAFADPENEYLIRQALTRLTRGKTVLMIAHRLTTVRHADSIVVMKEGAIVEEGTHDELMERNGTYRLMWDEYQRAVAWKL